ncbi:hypothetical protein QFZ96_003810 [Paraburkholderia youngii]
MMEYLALDHVRGAREGRVDIAESKRHVEEEVGRNVAVSPWRIRIEYLPDVAGDRQYLVVDLHQVGGVFGDVPAFCKDNGNRLADVAHLVRGQRRPHARLRQHVSRCQDRQWLPMCFIQISECPDMPYARYGLCCLRIDVLDAGVRVRRSHETAMQCSGKVDIVDELPLAFE